MVTVHTGAETIQGRKLFKGGNYMRKYGIYFRSIDFALEWLQLESGKALYKQNDEANSTYVVLSGRLRSVIRQENSKKTLVAEYGRGEFLRFF